MYLMQIKRLAHFARLLVISIVGLIFAAAELTRPAYGNEELSLPELVKLLDHKTNYFIIRTAA